jgi:hypothetical protein
MTQRRHRQGLTSQRCPLAIRLVPSDHPDRFPRDTRPLQSPIHGMLETLIETLFGRPQILAVALQVPTASSGEDERLAFVHVVFVTAGETDGPGSDDRVTRDAGDERGVDRVDGSPGSEWPGLADRYARDGSESFGIVSPSQGYAFTESFSGSLSEVRVVVVVVVMLVDDKVAQTALMTGTRGYG